MTTKFQGFAGFTDKGTPCYVINANETQYKVVLGSYTGYHGWSGGMRRDIVYAGRSGWIDKSKVVTAAKHKKAEMAKYLEESKAWREQALREHESAKSR